MIIGVVIALIAIWYFFLRKKKTESGFDGFGSANDPFGDDTPKCPAGEVYNDSLPGCVAEEKKESAYIHGTRFYRIKRQTT